MMKHLKTLRVRFALWTAGLLLAALTLFGLFVYLRMAQSLAEAVDDGLRGAAPQVVEEVNVRDGEVVSLDEFVDDLINTPLFKQGFSFRVFNNAGQIIQEYGPYRALPPPQLPRSHALREFGSEKNAASRSQTDAERGNERQQPGLFTSFTDEASGHPVRVYETLVVEDNQLVGTLQVARNMLDFHQTLNQLLTTLLIGVPLLVVGAGVGGYFLASRALTPIDQITRTARRISAQDLSARLNLPANDDEVGRLADTFDSMLARLEEAFQRERQFTADASHELRTPLTTMQTILHTTLAQSRTPIEYEAALFDLAEETDRMRSLTADLLHLARNEAAQPPTPLDSINLSTLLTDVVDTLRPLAEEKKLTLTQHIPHNLIIKGDHDGLIRLFVNVLANAIKYTHQGQITVIANSGGEGQVEIKIRDTGGGIPSEELPHIFDRFYRVDKSRTTSGTGLGLAIASNVAQSHRGTIEVESEVGLGTTFTVRLGENPSKSNI